MRCHICGRKAVFVSVAENPRPVCVVHAQQVLDELKHPPRKDSKPISQTHMFVCPKNDFLSLSGDVASTQPRNCPHCNSVLSHVQL